MHPCQGEETLYPTYIGSFSKDLPLRRATTPLKTSPHVETCHVKQQTWQVGRQREDGEWFKFGTPNKRAIQVAILPEIADQLVVRAYRQGISVETLVNVWLLHRLQETATVE